MVSSAYGPAGQDFLVQGIRMAHQFLRLEVLGKRASNRDRDYVPFIDHRTWKLEGYKVPNEGSHRPLIMTCVPHVIVRGKFDDSLLPLNTGQMLYFSLHYEDSNQKNIL